MNKKIEDIQKSIDIFREMIEKNSSKFSSGEYELTPRGKFDGRHNYGF